MFVMDESISGEDIIPETKTKDKNNACERAWQFIREWGATIRTSEASRTGKYPGIFIISVMMENWRNSQEKFPDCLIWTIYFYCTSLYYCSLQ